MATMEDLDAVADEAQPMLGGGTGSSAEKQLSRQCRLQPSDQCIRIRAAGVVVAVIAVAALALLGGGIVQSFRARAAGWQSALAEDWDDVLISTTLAPATLGPIGTSLFCFSVAQSSGFEKWVVRFQRMHKTSIFACEEWEVYSDDRIWINAVPPVEFATKLPIPVRSPKGNGGDVRGTTSWTNTDVFIAVWTDVGAHQRWSRHDWTVKVDPDCVFLPDRLRARLLAHPVGDPNGVYLRNCPERFGLFGALEVLSRVGVHSLVIHLLDCQRDLAWQGWGEDAFTAKCMESFNVSFQEDYTVLSDAYCGDENPSPCTSGKAAFHPFKTTRSYFQCYGEAMR